MREGETDELERIVNHRRIETLFQPIVDARDGAVFGHEALSRGPRDSPLHLPVDLFAAARAAGSIALLEERCLERAVERFRELRLEGRLFLNISPAAMDAAGGALAARLTRILGGLGVTPSRCVLEITEQNLFEDYASMRRALASLRDVGCEIAVDDLGAGYSGLKTWSEIRPEYVKIDRYFVSGIHTDAVKAEILRSIVEMGRAIGSRVIAEGVQSPQECVELVPEIYNRKTISQLMESPALAVDGRLRLEQVSRLVTRRTRPRVNDDFIVTRDGLYQGLGKVIEVLRQITAQQIQAAKDSNPLTLLPGNLRINEEIERMLSQRRRFLVCYFDLDNFKPYNDQYGYARGDQFLLHTSQLIRNTVCSRLDFLGHVGGDDFIAVLRSPDWRERLLELIEHFTASAPNLYDAQDRAAGGIRAIDRDGVLRTFPLASISVAALEIQPGRFVSAEQVAEELKRVKTQAKTRSGTCLLLAREAALDLLYPAG